MTKFIIKNNQFLQENDAKISIKERGFLFGDGIFETCKIFNGKIYNFKSHFARIKSGLEALKISAPIKELEENSQELIIKNDLENGLLRISISRGIGGLGYAPSADCKPLIIVETLEKRNLPKLINLGISKIKKPPQNSLPVAHKTMNALPYVLTKIQAKEENIFDLVMLSQDDFISETSSANIFWIKDRKIYTPDKSCDLLPGTIREKLLKLSKVKIIETKAKISELKNADEIFITNSSFLLRSVDEFMGKKLQTNLAKNLYEILHQDLVNTCK